MRANAHAHIQRDHTQAEMKIERRGGENRKKKTYSNTFSCFLMNLNFIHSIPKARISF